MEFFASYSGADFLIFYAGLLFAAVLAGLWIPAVMRPDGKRAPVEDIEDVAVLSGGAERHATAVLSDLFARGALDTDQKKRLQVVRTEIDTSEGGRAVLRKVGAFKLWQAKTTLKGRAAAIEADLIRRGLMLEPSERTKLRFLSVTPYIALFALGLYRQQAGEALGEPTGLLIGLLCLTFIFALVRVIFFNHRTLAGNAVIKELEEQSSRIKRAPQPTEAGYAVAIFGTAVLVGTPWEQVHAMRQAGSGGDGGADGSDGGGGGCGGGGCGGCGG